MKTLLILLGFLCFIAQKSISQSFQWKTLGTGISEGIPNNGVLINGKVYISGAFQTADDNHVNNCTAIDGDHLNHFGIIPGTKSYDFGYCAKTNTLYALSADSPNYMYKEGQQGEWTPVPILFNAQPIFLYAINDSELVISGEFTVVNGITVDYICIWNAVTNDIFDIGGLPGPANIGGMCVFLGKLLIPYYLSSSADPHFKEFNITTRNWDQNDALVLPNQVLYCLLADSETLYMSYLGMDGSSHIGKYVDEHWTVIGTFDGWGASGMTIDPNGSLIVCGSISSIDSVPISHGIVSYDGLLWHDFNGDPGGEPSKVLNYNGTLIAIGNLWLSGDRVGITEWVTETGIQPTEARTYLAYPNPAHDVLVIEGDQNSLVSLCDVSGRIIKTFRTTSNKTTVDVSVFPSGMYYLKSDSHAEKIVIVN